MAGSINKVILIGNVGKDPEVRYLENGSVVANFPMATSEIYTDKNTGKKIENTDWHDIVMWRGLAELAEKYVKKGHKIYIEGKLKKRSWQDKENNTRYTTEIIADVMTMLSRPTENSNRISNPPYSNEGTPNKPSNMDKEIDKENSDLPF